MAGTAISDIMKATNMAKGGIYGNFSGKEEICAEVFGFLVKTLSLRIDSAIVNEGTAKGKLFALLDFYLGTLSLSEKGGCPILNFGTEADDTSPEMKEQVNQAIVSFEKRISQLVSEGKKEGEFLETADAKRFAVKMFAMLEGAMLIGRVQNSNKQVKMIIDMLKEDIEGFST